MRALPDEFETSALIAVLKDGWGFDVEAVQYAAVGGGSYHWVVDDLTGARRFVTVDDLDRKPWLGETRESVFDGLRSCFDAAVALQRGGLSFVVAPIPTSQGQSLLRIGPRYTVALLPYVDGQAGRYGHYETTARAAVVTMLAEFHAATPALGAIALRTDLDLPGRQHLESALQEVNQTWFGGPFSEPAREALARGLSDVAELLARVDGLAIDVARRCSNWVVTHGEPHAANMMRTAGGYVLIDWDTVALGPPERDLWMVVGDAGDEASIYADLTGHRLDEAALDYYRLSWDLKDLATFVEVLRSPHRDTADTANAYAGVRACVANAATKL